MLAVIALLGILFSSLVVYFLFHRRIRLANCQNLFIINVAISDTLTCIVGVFRGLGIINSKFVGAPNKTTTLQCAIYTISLNNIVSSGILALLPLTFDRAIAIMLPLKHNSIMYSKLVTHSSCTAL